MEKTGRRVTLGRPEAWDTLVVTLTAVSDWLLLSDRPSHCLGPTAGRCLSEVMSFCDLESSRKSIQG